MEDLSVRAMVVQEGDDKVEQAVYYLSKKFLPHEVKYEQIQKTCAAVVWTTRKLRHYYQAYSIQVVAKEDPMRYLYESPSLGGKLSRWLILM